MKLRTTRIWILLMLLFAPGLFAQPSFKVSPKKLTFNFGSMPTVKDSIFVTYDTTMGISSDTALSMVVSVFPDTNNNIVLSNQLIYASRGDSFLRINVEDPQISDTIATGLPQMFAADFADSLDNTLYAIDENRYFTKIDTSNGDTTMVIQLSPAITGHDFTGMAFQPIDSTMYVTSSGGSDTLRTYLYSIDTLNGTLKKIGQVGADSDSFNIQGIASNIVDGSLFGVDVHNDRIVRIYTDSVMVGSSVAGDSLGYDADGLNTGLDFDPINGTFLITSLNSNSRKNGQAANELRHFPVPGGGAAFLTTLDGSTNYTAIPSGKGQADPCPCIQDEPPAECFTVNSNGEIVPLCYQAMSTTPNTFASYTKNGEPISQYIIRIFSEYLDVVDVWVGVRVTGIQEELEQYPDQFHLAQNYPNPFNPETLIEYYLPKRSKVTLTIYNALGQEVARLVETAQNIGLQQVRWNGRNSAGFPVASGIYFYQIQAGEYRATRKMFLMR